MKRITFLLVLFLVQTASLQAQPKKHRSVSSNAAAQSGQQHIQPSLRATLMFPTDVRVPEDVVWKRDIYRQLDLTKDKNASLYYPLEPQGSQVNLFTYLFRLVLTGRISAYNYKLDGNESFAPKDKISDIKDLLDRYYIYYEQKDGKYVVADTDVPSAQVKRMYIKESVVLDQHTGTYKRRVVALCPLLIEADEFGESAVAKPLFWVKYADAESYLSRLPIMASNYNNTTNMTANDFFTLNLYDGQIYKTNNMQGRVLGDYCKTDSAMHKEQKKIEDELDNFERHIWKVPVVVDSTTVDSLQNMPEKQKSSTRNIRHTSKQSQQSGARVPRRSNKQSIHEVNTQSQPRASVRRTRR